MNKWVMIVGTISLLMTQVGAFPVISSTDRCSLQAKSVVNYCALKPAAVNGNQMNAELSVSGNVYAGRFLMPHKSDVRYRNSVPPKIDPQMVIRPR